MVRIGYAVRNIPLNLIAKHRKVHSHLHYSPVHVGGSPSGTVPEEIQVRMLLYTCNSVISKSFVSTRSDEKNRWKRHTYT